MPTCCVCKNYSSKTRGKGIGYHRFPQDEVRLQKWLTAVKSHLQPAWTIEKIRAINNTQSPAHVCTEHFSSACCSENMKARFFQGKRPAKVLSEDAVPTIFGERKAGESSTSDLGQTAHRQPIQELLMPTSSPVLQPQPAPGAVVQQPCHTPSPGVQQPRHTPSPGVQQPHHTPSPGVQQPRHTPSPGVQQPRHTPSPGVQQPRHTPSPGVQQPRHTPSPGVQQPRHTPSRDVQQPRHTPSRDVQQPRHTPSPDLDALSDHDQPSHTLDEAALPPPNTPGPSCMQDTPLHGWPSCFSTPRSCSSSSLSFHSYCRVPSPTKYRDAATQTDDKLPSGKLPVRSSSPLPSPIKKCKNADLSFTSVSSVSTRVGEKDTTYHPSDDDAGSSASSPRTSKSMQQGEPTANYFIVRPRKFVDLIFQLGKIAGIVDIFQQVRLIARIVFHSSRRAQIS